MKWKLIRYSEIGSIPLIEMTLGDLLDKVAEVYRTTTASYATTSVS